MAAILILYLILVQRSCAAPEVRDGFGKLGHRLKLPLAVQLFVVLGGITWVSSR